MVEDRSLLGELNEAISRGSAEGRTRALWHATDLLISGRYSEDQIWIFGEVIGRLAEDIEVTARAQLSNRLASVEHAPTKVINTLAFDDSIEVAGPVLRQSGRLDTRSLIANAKSKSQQHLLAISQRKSLAEGVTDVLVVRGDREVTRSVTANPGAQFSKFGFLHLTQRSETDSILAEHLGVRRDIPRHIFQQLIAKASNDVREKLKRERPDIADKVQTVVTDVEGTVHAKFGPGSKSYFAAKRAVTALHRNGKLGEQEIWDFAMSRKTEEVTVALSILCNLSGDVVERTLTDNNCEMILIFAKTLQLSWSTTMALLFLAAPDHRIVAGDLENLKHAFERLELETARDVLRTYRSRKEMAAASSTARRLPQLHTR
jgi:uncharacterized protein (DUF2336 family)